MEKVTEKHTEKCYILEYLAKTVHIFRRNVMTFAPFMTMPQ